MRAALRLLAAAGVLALGLVAAAAPSSADRIALRIEVFGALGLPVATSRMAVEDTAERYAIASDLRTLGVVGMLVDLASHAEVQGRIIADMPRPLAYRVDVRRDGIDRHNHVEYRADGSVSGGSTPPPSERLTPVTPEHMQGTTDNLTAYFRVERQVAKTGSCAAIMPVFDGRQRYDLHFSDIGAQTLAATAGHQFAGPVHACRMVRREIAGFPIDPRKSEGARRATLWYGQLFADRRILAVRLELETEIGTLNAYLAEVHGRGVDRVLME